MRSKVVEAVQFVELFIRGVGLTLGPESDAKGVMSFLEVGLDGNGALVGCDRAGVVTAGPQFHAEVVLRFGIVGIDRDGFAKFSEGIDVLALTAQCDAKNGVG